MIVGTSELSLAVRLYSRQLAPDQLRGDVYTCREQSWAVDDRERMSMARRRLFSSHLDAAHIRLKTQKHKRDVDPPMRTGNGVSAARPRGPSVVIGLQFLPVRPIG